MSKHTQGAWRYVDGYLDCEVWVDNKMVLSYPRNPTDEDRANARLMAAAPELLEALKEACEQIESEWPGEFTLGRAAIAKATGCDL